VQSAAVAERERVTQLFAEAVATLQRFQTEVLGFIKEGESTMLGHSQGDLQRQEEQRSRLSRARHNLSQVPEADSVSFLQVSKALSHRRSRRGGETGTGEEWRWGQWVLGFPKLC
jgi:tripartite motif-containing protein 47